MIQEDKLNLAALKTPAIMAGVFWIIAVVLWQTTGRIFYLFNFGYIGAAIGLGIGTYAALSKRQKHWGRKLAQLLVGLYMLVFLGLLQRENMQIEGFWFYLLSGFFAGSVIHYLVAKVAGPLVFNRGWCGCRAGRRWYWISCPIAGPGHNATSAGGWTSGGICATFTWRSAWDWYWCCGSAGAIACRIRV